MVAQILDGKILASQLQKETASEIDSLNVYPCLAVCLVGDDPASHIYVKHKQKACLEVGITPILARMPSEVTQEELLDLIKEWNADPSIHGILVQLPLPSHIDRDKVINSVCANKDVDGFNEINIGRLSQNCPKFIPCTPLAVQYLLTKYNIDVESKHVVIVNDSIVLGKPLANMLLAQKATVTLCNKYTSDLKSITTMADIVVTAVGKRPQFVLGKEMIKPGAVVVDVGINRINGKVCGDVDFESVSQVASWISPVPGSVGLLTVQFLLKNTVKAAKEL